MSRAAGRISRWMNRILDADERYICAACDERFPGRFEGVSHVTACHPEFAGMLTTDSIGRHWTPASEPVPVRPLGTTRPLQPVLS